MDKDQPDVHYTPKGLKIPVPTRGEFDANLDKVLKAPAPKKVLGLRSRRKDAGPTQQ
jgi:hypothetical protein